MGNDIEIRVRVANNTNAGLTAVNNSLNRLRDEARDAGRGLDGLAARATLASAALRSLKDSAQDASRALRSLNTAARNADTRMGSMSDRSRTLRRDTDELDGSMRRLTTTMGGLRSSNGSINLNSSSSSMDGLRKAALLLSPALIPIAAAAVPIVTSVGAATVAVGAFGLAIAGQISLISDASDAQKKYDEAVKQHGAASDQATKAEAAYLAQVKQLDPATRRSAAALTVLKDQYKQWSKDLAGDTMPVFTKGMANLGALLPQMAPLVRATSTELDRLMTVLAGGINSNGFSSFMSSFSEFAAGALSKATNSLVHFMRVAQGGTGSSQLSEFMAYVKEVGPQVGETLANLGRALTHLIAAASETGVSLLTVVNAFAGLVNAIPTGTLSNLIQFAVVFKAVKMAALGLGGAGGALAGFGAQLVAMRAASAAAGGGLRGVAAGFGALSRATKVALIGSGIGILVVALSELSEMGKKAPADIDKLTTSMRSFASGGAVSGEAARVFGKDLSGLADSLQKVKDPKGLDQVQQSIVSFFGTDSTPVKDAKENIDALDQSLANLVKNGQADLAASALDNITAQMKKQGFSTKDITSNLDDYKAALADQAFEAQLAAQSMGLFGEQAAAVQAKLDGQKASADGLRQAIVALNDVQRQGLGGMIGFEAAIDAAAKAAKDNAGALTMSHGQLDLNSEKARNAATALNDLAAKTEDAATAARESGSSWETVSGIYARGREQFIQSAQAMGLNKEQAAQLAAQILQLPDQKTTKFEMRTEDAIAGLDSVLGALKKTPNAKSVTVEALTSDAVSMLRSLGLTVKQMPDGRFTVTANTGTARSAIAAVQAARDALKNKSITLSAQDKASATARSIAAAIAAIRSKTVTLTTVQHTLGIEGTAGRANKNLNGMAEGGHITGGSGTRDDVPLLAMGGEFIVNKRQTAKYQSLLEAINEDRVPKFAKGGLTKGQLTGLSQPSDVAGLSSTLAEVRTSIKSRTSGSTETRLLRTLDAVGKKLLANEKSLTSVNKALDGAKTKLNDLRQTASQLSGSVRSGVLSAAAITGGAGGDKPTTLASIMSGLTASRDKATAFSGALKGLQSKGVRSDLIQQIAEAGINGGGLDTAGALLGASSSEIGSLNNLQSQIAAAAKSAGQTTSTAVYGAAIKAQAEAAAKLQRSQDKLEKTMSDLVKSLNRAVVKSGGKAAGGIVGAAASGGVRGGLTWVGEHEPELLQLPAGSRVWSGPDSRRKAAAVGGGGREVRVVLELRSSGSSRYEEFLLSELRSAINQRGGNAQLVLTGRKQP